MSGFTFNNIFAETPSRAPPIMSSSSPQLNGIWHHLYKQKKAEIKKMVTKCIRENADFGLDNSIPIDKSTFTVRQLLPLLKYNPKGRLTLKKFKTAIRMYKLSSGTSRRFLQKQMYRILFKHPEWVTAKNGKILKRLINCKGVETLPSDSLTKTLQTLYLRRIFGRFSSPSDVPDLLIDACIAKRSLIRRIYEKRAYHAWIRNWEIPSRFYKKSYKSKILRLPKILTLKDVPISKRFDRNQSLFSSLLRKDWKVFDDIFVDVSQIKQWPSEDRKFVTSIIFDAAKMLSLPFTRRRRPFPALLSRMFKILKSPKPLALFLVFMTKNLEIVKACWPTTRLQPVDWKVFLNSKRRRYLAKRVSTPDLIYFFVSADLIFGRLFDYLLFAKPEKFRILMAHGCFHKWRPEESITYYAEDDLTAIEIVMLGLINGDMKLHEALFCMAKGTIPKHTYPSVNEAVCKILLYSEVAPIPIISYFTEKQSVGELTVEDLSAIPPTLLQDDAALCRFVVGRLWSEASEGRFNSDQWTPTLFTALLFFDRHFEAVQ